MTYENTTELYLAYGSNMNHEQMIMRCPDATFVGTARLLGWQLVFRGVADIEQVRRSSVPVAMWLTTPKCRAALDRYEGAPNLYKRNYGHRKALPLDLIKFKILSYELDGDYVQEEELSIADQAQITSLPRFSYVMTAQYQDKYREPSYDYYHSIVQGYTDCGLVDKHGLSMTAAASAMRAGNESKAKKGWFTYLHGEGN